jgi:hypothetical protein
MFFPLLPKDAPFECAVLILSISKTLKAAWQAIPDYKLYFN